MQHGLYVMRTKPVPNTGQNKGRNMIHMGVSLGVDFLLLKLKDSSEKKAWSGMISDHAKHVLSVWMSSSSKVVSTAVSQTILIVWFVFRYPGDSCKAEMMLFAVLTPTTTTCGCKKNHRFVLLKTYSSSHAWEIDRQFLGVIGRSHTEYLLHRPALATSCNHLRLLWIKFNEMHFIAFLSLHFSHAYWCHPEPKYRNMSQYVNVWMQSETSSCCCHLTWTGLGQWGLCYHIMFIKAKFITHTQQIQIIIGWLPAGSNIH